LTILEFILIFFGTTVLIISQKGHDEFDELINCLGRAEGVVVLDDGLYDFDGDLPLVLEFHVLHEGEVVVHAQDCDRK